MAYKAKFLTPAEGGLGAATVATSGKLLTGNGTNWVASTPTFPTGSATSGKFLQSDGTNWIASTPTFPTTAGTSGKMLVSNGTNWVSSTPTFPNASATAGKLIVSDGTNWVASTPTYPNASATTRKILVSDGTNFVASTETWSNPGTSGNLLSSDGTNWVTTVTPSVTSITLSAGTALNKYVVGTFTPALNFGGAAVGITYSSQNGQYTQIGNTIFFTFVLDMTSKGSSVGAATITGFPVTSGTHGNNCMAPFVMQRLTLTTNYTVALFQMGNSSTTASLFQQGSGQAFATLTDTNFASNTTIFCEGFYHTA